MNLLDLYKAYYQQAQEIGIPDEHLLKLFIKPIFLKKTEAFQVFLRGDTSDGNVILFVSRIDEKTFEAKSVSYLDYEQDCRYDFFRYDQLHEALQFAIKTAKEIYEKQKDLDGFDQYINLV